MRAVAGGGGRDGDSEEAVRRVAILANASERDAEYETWKRREGMQNARIG